MQSIGRSKIQIIQFHRRYKIYSLKNQSIAIWIVKRKKNQYSLDNENKCYSFSVFWIFYIINFFIHKFFYNFSWFLMNWILFIGFCCCVLCFTRYEQNNLKIAIIVREVAANWSEKYFIDSLYFSHLHFYELNCVLWLLIQASSIQPHQLIADIERVLCSVCRPYLSILHNHFQQLIETSGNITARTTANRAFNSFPSELRIIE